MKNKKTIELKIAEIERNTVRGRTADLPLSKIFWNAGEKSSDGKVAQITLTRNYGGQYLGILTRMFDIARQDFPDAQLDINNVASVVLGGSFRKGMWGIEFSLPAGTEIPDSYKQRQSELILSGGL